SIASEILRDSSSKPRMASASSAIVNGKSKSLLNAHGASGGSLYWSSATSSSRRRRSSFVSRQRRSHPPKRGERERETSGSPFRCVFAVVALDLSRRGGVLAGGVRRGLSSKHTIGRSGSGISAQR